MAGATRRKGRAAKKPVLVKGGPDPRFKNPRKAHPHTIKAINLTLERHQMEIAGLLEEARVQENKPAAAGWQLDMSGYWHQGIRPAAPPAPAPPKDKK